MSRKWLSSGRAFALVGVTAATLAGCGANAFKSDAGSVTPGAGSAGLGYGVTDVAPRPHVQCMQKLGLPARRIGLTKIQIGPPPAGPTVIFEPDPNGAEMEQIQGNAAGAEIIGASMLFVHSAPDSELAKIEKCLDAGVAG